MVDTLTSLDLRYLIQKARILLTGRQGVTYPACKLYGLDFRDLVEKQSIGHA